MGQPAHDALPAIALGVDTPKRYHDFKTAEPQTKHRQRVAALQHLGGHLAAAALILYFAVIDTYGIEKHELSFFPPLWCLNSFWCFQCATKKRISSPTFSQTSFLFSIVLSCSFNFLPSTIRSCKAYYTQCRCIGETGSTWEILSMFAIFILELWKFFRKKPLHV